MTSDPVADWPVQQGRGRSQSEEGEVCWGAGGGASPLKAGEEEEGLMKTWILKEVSSSGLELE